MEQQQQQNIEALSERVRGDSASLLARYGGNLVAAGAGAGGGTQQAGGAALWPYLASMKAA